MRIHPLLHFIAFLCLTSEAWTQNDKYSIPCREDEIPRYSAYKTTEEIKIDGKLDEKTWKQVARSGSFRDLISGEPTRLDTRAAVTWNDEYLYVAYWIEEPHLHASHTKRDAPIYEDNDVELFIAGKDGYYEFEINSYGTIYEVMFFWMDAYKKHRYDTLPGFAEHAPGARRFNGVGYRHPRGARIGFWQWDMPGLASAVQVNGTINDDVDQDNGWTVELAIPWTSLQILSGGRSLPPKTGDTWQMDFSRFNKKKHSTTDSGGWAWSPHGVWDSHVPECFTLISFSDMQQ
jgi:hypothetical protein